MGRETEKETVSDDDYKERVEDHEILLHIKRMGGIAAGKSTPSPAWKLEEEADLGFVERRRKSVSARKLGANLWEMEDLLPVAVMRRRSGRPRRCRDGGDMGGVDLQPLGSPDRVISYNPTISPCSLLNLKGKIGDARYSLRASLELLKVLNRIFSLEEQHASNISLVKSLQKELQGAKTYIQELKLEKKSYYHKIHDLINQVEEDILVRKNKEGDRMKAVIHSLREELDNERRLRRQCENLHRKLGKELAHTKTTLLNTLEDLENERKSNVLLEDLCDELATGIGHYEKEKREYEDKKLGDCEHGVDGLMLHISKFWLEKSSQMHHGDQNKVTIASRLKAEILAFLQARRAKNIKDENEQHYDGVLHHQSLESLHLNGTVSAPCDVKDNDSVANAPLCFELNMDKTNTDIHGQLKLQCEVYHNSNQAKSTSMSQGGLNRKYKGKEFCMIDLQTEADCGEDTTKRRSANSSSFFHYDRKIDEMEDSPLMNHYHVKSLLENSSGCKVHNLNHGEISHTKCPQFLHFLSNNVDNLEDVQTASSPVQQWKYTRTPADHEITECSLKLPQGMKENNLKAKLLEARSEGQYARLRAMQIESMEAKGQ